MRKAIFLVGVFFLLQANSVHALSTKQSLTQIPFQIKTCQDLQNIQNNLAGNFVLANDITDCKIISNFQPIGGISDLYPPFTGTLNGQGHTIKGLTINVSNSNNAGLFATIGSPATVSNMVLDSFVVKGGSNTGVLAGEIVSGNINNVIVSNANITNNNGNFNSNDYSILGGIVGKFESGMISNSAATNVSIVGYGGGAVYIGGLVGQEGMVNTTLTAQISESYSTGVLTGSPTMGGLVGTLFNGSIVNSYSLAQLPDAGAAVGGLIGEVSNLSFNPVNVITNSFAAGRVYGTGTTGVVGIVESDGGAVNSIGTYWDTQTTGQSSDRLSSTIGKTTAQMYQESTYVGWDFTDVWTMNNGNDYPHLKWENTAIYIHNCQDLQNMNNKLSGTYIMANDITDCSSISNFQPVGSNSNTPFIGNLDGNGYTIYNLNIEASNTSAGIAGLFGFMNGQVSNLNIKSSAVSAINTGSAGLFADQIGVNGSVTNVTVQGTVVGANNTTLGGIAAVNNGSILKTYANVNVTGTYLSYVGGLIGTNFGNISQSYSTGTVQGTSAGGLVGANNSYGINTGTIQNSYSLATVILPAFDEPSDNVAGGLVGEDWNDYHGNISNSYAAGLVKISGTMPVPYTLGGAIGILFNPSNGPYTVPAESVYWDKQATHQAHSAFLVTPDANGKTTLQMHQAATFVKWDFKTPVWVITSAYPFLAWQPVQITLKLAGSGKGVITSTPSGLDCAPGSSQGCSATFPSMEAITLNFDSSNNSGVASWGVCKSTSSGSCTITPGQSATISIDLEPTYTITANADSGGVIVPSLVNVARGANYTFTLAANPDYIIHGLLEDYVAVPVAANGNFILKNVQAPHRLTATFDPEISVEAATGITISPKGTAGLVSVVSGGYKTFTVTAQAGYKIAGVLADKVPVSLTPTNTYTFTDVTIPHIFQVNSSVIIYNVSANADTGGSIFPNGNVSINYNGSQLFTLTPSQGFSVDELLDYGTAVPLSKNGTYNLKNVKAAHMLTAIFDPDITVTAGTGGTITPAGVSGVVSVVSGANKIFTVTAKNGYKISTVTVDNYPASLTSKNAYEFTDVIGPHSISATFVAN